MLLKQASQAGSALCAPRRGLARRLILSLAFPYFEDAPLARSWAGTMQMSDWNPILYAKFESERMRAARDLLAQVPLASADLVYDLGCGPGNSAELLLRRFPDARTIGLDTSDAMLAQARMRARKAHFVKQDIKGWAPDDRPDLIFANAALQFLPDHDQLFPASCLILRPAESWPRKCRTPRANPRTR